MHREESWITHRAKDLYRESKRLAEAAGAVLPEFISRRDLPEVLHRLNASSYLDQQVQELFDEMIAEHRKRAAIAEHEAVSREAVIQEEVEKRLKPIRNDLEEKSYKDRLRLNAMTLVFLRSIMLAIAIPIIGASAVI